MEPTAEEYKQKLTENNVLFLWDKVKGKNRFMCADKGCSYEVWFEGYEKFVDHLVKHHHAYKPDFAIGDGQWGKWINGQRTDITHNPIKYEEITQEQVEEILPEKLGSEKNIAYEDRIKHSKLLDSLNIKYELIRQTFKSGSQWLWKCGKCGAKYQWSKFPLHLKNKHNIHIDGSTPEPKKTINKKAESNRIRFNKLRNKRHEILTEHGIPFEMKIKNFPSGKKTEWYCKIDNCYFHSTWTAYFAHLKNVHGIDDVTKYQLEPIPQPNNKIDHSDEYLETKFEDFKRQFISWTKAEINSRFTENIVYAKRDIITEINNNKTISKLKKDFNMINECFKVIDINLEKDLNDIRKDIKGVNNVIEVINNRTDNICDDIKTLFQQIEELKTSDSPKPPTKILTDCPVCFNPLLWTTDKTTAFCNDCKIKMEYENEQEVIPDEIYNHKNIVEKYDLWEPTDDIESRLSQLERENVYLRDEIKKLTVPAKQKFWKK